jgi:DNA-binding transcriptional MerR regulator
MAWSVDELVRRAAQALADGDVRSANGRVTALPDQRLIRWYATIGLVDRPLASQGRSARYGPRHLLQLVAIKRRQAEGRPLADIQVELAGAPDATLARIAQVPDHLLTDQPQNPRPVADQRRFWTTPPAEPPTVDKPLTGVRLGEAVLLIPGKPDASDLAAIRAAAQPLLDVLVYRGLLPPPGGSTA